MRVWAVPFLLVLAMSVYSTPATPGCRWDETGPVCRGECNANEVQVRRWDGGGSLFTPFDTEGEPHFGAGCLSGEKALCCAKCAAGLVSEGLPLEQRCVTPEQKAADDARQVSPGPQFCEYYASKAIDQVASAADCGFSGPRWDPNKQDHLNWCLAQKGQSSSWSEFYSREGEIKDCLIKKTSAPSGGLMSAGPPVVTVPQDVDIYASPGGVGRPFGFVKAGSRVTEIDARPDQWCHIIGDAAPLGNGWVWCGSGFELK